jgi:transposase
MALYSRTLKADEKLKLEELLKDSDEELARRVEIVLLSAQRTGVHEISEMVGLHPINVRKWIHRFNRFGINGLYPRRSPGRPRLFSREQRDAIVGLATTEPRVLGLDFDAWSLQRLRSQLIERGVMSDVSAETIRQELLRNGLVFEERRWVAAGR